MNQNVLFDIANRLARLESYVEDNRYLCNDITVLQVLQKQDHSHIVDAYDTLNKFFDRLSKLERAQEQTETLKLQVKLLEDKLISNIVETETLKTRLNTLENKLKDSTVKKVEFKK
jgi:hypothetical protein